MTRNVLAAYRLSHDTDESTSVERQQERSHLWTQMQDDARIVAEPTDADVSGKVPAFERPELGPYFREPLCATWDTLVVAKLDRLTRSVADFAAIMEWAKANGKTIVSIAESFDLSTAAGRMVAQIMAVFAEFERERISERCAESAAKLARVGRWRGGKVPFGYVRAGVKGNYKLAQDTELASIVARMADIAISGQSNGQVAAWLNTESVPCPKGGYEWTPEIVRVMLRNPSLAGRMVAHGKVILDDDGEIVMATAEPILTAERWNELQAALDSRSQVHPERVGGHLLLRVAYCASCSRFTVKGGRPKIDHDHRPGERCSATRCQVPLYGHEKQGRSREGSNYRCQRCGYRVRKDVIESTVQRVLLHDIGDKPLPRKVIIPAVSHTAELEKIERQISDLDDALVNGDTTAAAHGRIMKRLEDRRDHLAAMPQRAAEVRYEPTDQTVREHWASLDREARGRFLRTWGVLAYADESGPHIAMGWEHLDDAEGSLMAQAFGLA
jgi:DNA invertase Pin-like site-specific DNA recombinase